MAFPTYPTIPDPWPDRAQGQAAFDSAVSGTFTFFGNLQTWAGAWETEAEGLQAALVAGNLPSLTGQAGRAVIVNGDEDGVAFSAPLSTLSGHRNKIINGQFTIWQRGTSFTADGHTADRWQFVNGAGAANTITRQSFTFGQADVPGEPEFYLRWARGTAGSGASLLTQRIKGVRTLAGQTATVTYWVRASAATTLSPELIQSFGSGGSANVTIPLPAVNVTTSWKKVSVAEDIPSITGKTLGSGNALILRFSRPHDATNPTANIEIANVSVVPGDDTNEDDPGAWRSDIEELTLCRQYYRTMGRGLMGFAISATAIRLGFPIDPPMQAAPSLTLLNTSPSIYIGGADVVASGSELSGVSVTSDGARITNMNGFSGLTAGDIAILQTANTFGLDAEL